MGAPKQKWTAEEELALKAGIAKYGSGKWSTILKDPEFSGILCLRSNVDLKVGPGLVLSAKDHHWFLAPRKPPRGFKMDKWRNLRVTASGMGSRQKARVALKKSRETPKADDDSMSPSTVAEDDDSNEIVDAKPIWISAEPIQISPPKKSEAKLENLILEAITNLKEPTGSSEASITAYIDDCYVSPPDFKRLFCAKLKKMRETGKLLKAKHKYRIAPSSSSPKGRSPKVLLSKEIEREPFRVDRGEIKLLNKPQIDADLALMRHMKREEAAAAAAQAVAEAEVAMAEAEEAMRQAEAAEADAEAAQAFAEAASSTLKNKSAAVMWAGVAW